MTTRHPDIERWTDFVHGLLESDEEATMRSHLDAGCRPCARRLETARRMAAVARADAETALPEAAVHLVKSLAALAPRALPREGAWWRDVPLRAVFDSALEPAPAGTRGQESCDRQLVFRSADYTLHVHLEPRAAGSRRSVTGLLLDGAGRPLTRVPACLVAGGGAASFGVTSDEGAFDLASDLDDEEGELRFLVDDDLRIAVELGTQRRA